MGRVDLDSELSDEDDDERRKRDGEAEDEEETDFTIGYEPADHRKNLDSWDRLAEFCHFFPCNLGTFH